MKQRGGKCEVQDGRKHTALQWSCRTLWEAYPHLPRLVDDDTLPAHRLLLRRAGDTPALPPLLTLQGGHALDATLMACTVRSSQPSPSHTCRLVNSNGQ